MKVMVVGGTGFLGAWVCAAFRDGGYEVIAMDIRPPRDETAEMLHGVQYAEGSVDDEAAVMAMVAAQRPDVLVNLAYLAGAASEQEPHLATRINLLGPSHCMQAAVAAGVRRYLYASSIGAYGPSQSLYGERALSESDGCRLEQHGIAYGAMKAMNEYMAGKFFRYKGLDSCGLRVSVLFGPWREHGFTAWASEAASQPALGRAVYIPFRSAQRVSLVYVGDVAAMFVRAAALRESGAMIYNTGGYNLSIREFTDLIRRIEPSAAFSFDESAPEQPFVWDVSAARMLERWGTGLLPVEQALRDHMNRARCAAGMASLY